MEGGSEEAISSSGQLEDWAAGVAADLNEDRAEDKRRSVDRASTSPERQRATSNQCSGTPKRSRQLQESQSSAEEDEHGAKEGPADGHRAKLPRPSSPRACPRCNSMDTKFCYYNNYNVKQPRFYCKSCQRYWTAGGTLRNIAPGSGRRKSKSKTIGREQRDSASLADHLSAAAQFGLPVSGLSPALLTSSPPPGLLASGHAAASSGYANPPFLGAHSSMTGVRLSGMPALQGHQWAGGSNLPADLGGSLALLDHLQAQRGTAGAAPSLALSGQPQLAGLDARLLVGGHHSNLDVLSISTLVQPLKQQSTARSVSPPPSCTAPPQQHQHQQQQLSSPQQLNSQSSQQPSPPQLQRGGSVSNEGGVDGTEICAQAGRRIRLKMEAEGTVCSGMGPLKGSSSSCLGTVVSGAASSPFSTTQIASLGLHPSMATLAGVMGPGAAPSASLGSGVLHPLLGKQDGSGRSTAEVAHAQSHARQQLQLALQQHQQQLQQSALAHQQLQQQQEALYQLNGLVMPQSNSIATAAALGAQHSLLHGLGQHHAGPAAAAAALDSAHCSALLHQAAGLSGMGGWLQGGSGLPGVLSSPAAVAAAALQSQSLSSSTAACLMQHQPTAAVGNSGVGGAADWLTLAAAAASGGNKMHIQAAAGQAQQSSSAAAMVAAANAAGGFGGGVMGGSMAAAHMLQQAHAAASAANGGCDLSAAGWMGAGGLPSGMGSGPSWSLWPSYGNQPSNNYAGYALQAAAAAYSGGR